MALAIPKRRSSQNFSLYQSSLASPRMPTPSAPRVPKHERTIPARGRSVSPIRRSAHPEVRKAPSRTFIPPIVPTDILDFPKVHHPRIEAELILSAPVFVGGATVEGDAHITIDGGPKDARKKIRSTLSISRIVISLIGIERSNGRRHIFRRLATELIDETHPPPIEMAPTGRRPAETSWEVLPSVSILPFRLDLPVTMGPPPYTAKRQGILYLLSITIEAKIAGKQEFVRRSRGVTVLTVHDPEKALVSLPSPLTASEELRFSSTDNSLPIRVTAGLHRQTWISGYMLFVDVQVQNKSSRDVNKIVVQLEKATIVYAFSPASTRIGSADTLRIPDYCERSIVASSIFKSKSDVVPAYTEVLRTCRIEVPTGLVSVNTGRFFGVRFFLNVQISCFFAKHFTIQLPVTIIHPNSVDVPPNSVAQVATAIEHKHRDHTSINGSPYRYTPGRAFTAARERSQGRLHANTLSPREVRDLTLRLDGSPRKIKHRRSHMGVSSQHSAAREKENNYNSLRARASLDSYRPSLQRSTSGLAFDDSDKENVQEGPMKTPVTIKANRSPFSRSVLRELDVRAIRNSALSGFTHVATSTLRK